MQAGAVITPPIVLERFGVWTRRKGWFEMGSYVSTLSVSPTPREIGEYVGPRPWKLRRWKKNPYSSIIHGRRFLRSRRITRQIIRIALENQDRCVNNNFTCSERYSNQFGLLLRSSYAPMQFAIMTAMKVLFQSALSPITDVIFFVLPRVYFYKHSISWFVPQPNAYVTLFTFIFAHIKLVTLLTLRTSSWQQFQDMNMYFLYTSSWQWVKKITRMNSQQVYIFF